MRNKNQQRKQEWEQWEEQAQGEAAQRQQPLPVPAVRPTQATARRQQRESEQLQQFEAQQDRHQMGSALESSSTQAHHQAVQPPMSAPLAQKIVQAEVSILTDGSNSSLTELPTVPPRLRSEQQAAFAAANQEVERQQRVREQQFADVQARMQQRIAERRRKAGRWMGSETGGPGFQAAAQQQQEQPPPAAAMPNLGLLARSGLQRKVAQFAEVTNFLRRSQDARGVGFSWGRSNRQPPPPHSEEHSQEWQQAQGSQGMRDEQDPRLPPQPPQQQPLQPSHTQAAVPDDDAGQLDW